MSNAVPVRDLPNHHEIYAGRAPAIVKWYLLGFGTLALLLPVVAAGCGLTAAKTPEKAGKKVSEVVVTVPIKGQVIDYQDFTGRLDGFRTIDIRARVTGYVLTAPFKEGDLVHEGDLLFQIDPTTYQADLNLAAANLNLARADQNLQDKIARRAQVMFGSRSIAQEDYDTAVATAQKSKATVDAMAAARDRSQRYLDWTRVTAPLTGRISRRLVDPGNLINADQTVLTTIVSDQDLYAYFDVDERTYLNLVGPVSPGQQGSWLLGLQFPVLMQLANEEQAGFTHPGTVNFIDNRVSATTGTIRMRAVFDNSHGSLRAGLFVRVRLPIGSPYQAILIPDVALQSDQGRQYVYTVNDKNEVVYCPVVTGQSIHELRAIKSGISLGDRVIVSGMQRVRQGATVQVKPQDPPKPPESPLVKLLNANKSDKVTR